MNSINRMKENRIWIKLFCGTAFIVLVTGGFPARSRSDIGLIAPADLAYSEPIEVTSKIMDINYSSNMLIVVESKVYVIDLTFGSQKVKTDLSDADGKPIAFGALGRGQKIMVRGMKLPDGRVIAGQVVRLNGSTGNFCPLCF